MDIIHFYPGPFEKFLAYIINCCVLHAFLKNRSFTAIEVPANRPPFHKIDLLRNSHVSKRFFVVFGNVPEVVVHPLFDIVFFTQNHGNLWFPVICF
jgi:hypothetical protein